MPRGEASPLAAMRPPSDRAPGRLRPGIREPIGPSILLFLMATCATRANNVPSRGEEVETGHESIPDDIPAGIQNRLAIFLDDISLPLVRRRVVSGRDSTVSTNSAFKRNFLPFRRVNSIIFSRFPAGRSPKGNLPALLRSYYLRMFTTSWSMASPVVITRAFAWNPRCVMIRSVNSLPGPHWIVPKSPRNRAPVASRRMPNTTVPELGLS